jgi:hypothetical protein
MSETIAYASVARTATPTAYVLELSVITGLVVVIDVTAIGPAPSVVCTLDGVDTVSGKFYNILTATALVAVTGATPRVLRVGRGLLAAANLVANDMVPEKVRITMTHGNADSITYSVCAHLLYS